MLMPALETERLLIRPLALDDLEAIYQILDVDLAEAALGTEGAQTRTDRAQWLQWTIMSYEQLAMLHQPPYGERAVVLKQTGTLIGACGYAPCLDAFGQLPGFAAPEGAAGMRLNSTRMGLFWALAPAYQHQGYATEAARTLIDYAFSRLNLHHIVATTTYDNAASMAVMRRVGMRIERNPYPDPPWLQVVGILMHPGIRSAGLPA
jgi:RimJ/RimL family protein N-acetyltransferase